MAIKIYQLVDKISQLEISGVRVRDMDEIPAGVNERDCPIMIPDPQPPGFITNVTVVRDTSGLAAIADKTVTYTLNYAFLFAPIGDDRTLGLENYPKMTKKAFAILDAFILADAIASGTSYDAIVDITPVGITDFGVVSDPAGYQFTGCRFQFLVTEFIN